MKYKCKGEKHVYSVLDGKNYLYKNKTDEELAEIAGITPYGVYNRCANTGKITIDGVRYELVYEGIATPIYNVYLSGHLYTSGTRKQIMARTGWKEHTFILYKRGNVGMNVNIVDTGKRVLYKDELYGR